MTEGGDSDVGGGGGHKRFSSSLPEEMKGVLKSNPPPFLTKIYKIVEDETDSVVCWSPCGTSFIILDHHRFAIEILPKYFRHSNFSSFIYQLNNYGFRKISENWEYWNEWFQAGKKHLLKNIKRRKEKAQVKEKQTAKMTCIDSDKLCFEAEIKGLKSNHNKLKVELAKLEEKLENAEKITSTYQRIMIFMVNSFHATSSQQLLQKLKETREAESEGESLKRRKIDLNEPQSNTEETTEITCTVQTSSESVIGGDRVQQDEEANAEEGNDNAIMGRQFPDSGSERFKHMEDVLMSEDDGEGETVMYRSEIDKEYWEALLKNEDPYGS